MGNFMNILLGIASLLIIALGVFLLRHPNRQENVEDYLKIVASLCIFLGLSGLLIIIILEFF